MSNQKRNDETETQNSVVSNASFGEKLLQSPSHIQDSRSPSNATSHCAKAQGKKRPPAALIPKHLPTRQQHVWKGSWKGSEMTFCMSCIFCHG